jgi:hypothetical protein
MSKCIALVFLFGLMASYATVFATESGAALGNVRVLSFRVVESESGQNELMFQEFEWALMASTSLSRIVSSYSKDSIRMDLSFDTSVDLDNSTGFIDAIAAKLRAAHPEIQLAPELPASVHPESLACRQVPAARCLPPEVQAKKTGARVSSRALTFADAASSASL